MHVPASYGASQGRLLRLVRPVHALHVYGPVRRPDGLPALELLLQMVEVHHLIVGAVDLSALMEVLSSRIARLSPSSGGAIRGSWS